MKHIKLYEYWSNPTSTLGDVIASYDDSDGDDDKIDDVIYQIKKFISDKYKEIDEIDGSFDQYIIDVGGCLFTLSHNEDNMIDDRYLLNVLISGSEDDSNNIPLSESEYKDFYSFMDGIVFKYSKFKSKDAENNILDEIIPMRKSASKYNI